MNSLDFLKDPNRLFNFYETNIQLCVSTGQVRSIREIRNAYEIAPGPCKSTLTFLGTSMQMVLLWPLLLFILI